MNGSSTEPAPATGKPLLANDPHLELNIPILWYLARITTPEITISGATAPGTPLVLLGQNGHIAWGFTTTDSDTQDLFIETAVAGHPDQYQTPDGPQPIRMEPIAIKVKGAAPVEMIRQETRHGPVISGIGQADGVAGDDAMVSLAWTGFATDDTTAEAFYRINLARNKDEFLQALRLYKSPAQNIVYADREGNIGFVNAGAVPIRKSGDGRYPADGASGANDWTAMVPFEGWPQLFNPPDGAIVNANNPVVPPDYPYWFGRDQTLGFRAKRIGELIGAKPLHDMDSMAAIQMDIQAVHARDLVPFLLKLQPDNDMERQALQLLKTWDFAARRDRPEALILDWWLRRMNEHLLKSGLDPVAADVRRAERLSGDRAAAAARWILPDRRSRAGLHEGREVGVPGDARRAVAALRHRRCSVAMGRRACSADGKPGAGQCAGVPRAVRQGIPERRRVLFRQSRRQSWRAGQGASAGARLGRRISRHLRPRRSGALALHHRHRAKRSSVVAILCRSVAAVSGGQEHQARCERG